MSPFWLLFALAAFTFVVGQLLAPTPKSGLRPNLGDIKPPSADKGKPIPVIFGTVKIAPNVVWYGNVRAIPITERVRKNLFSKTKITVGYEYGADMHFVLCHGPIDELVDVVFGDDKSLNKLGSATTTSYPHRFALRPVTQTFGATPALPENPPAGNDPLLLDINAPDLLGGEKHGGGVVGKLYLWFGKETQVRLTALTSIYSGVISRYKGIVHGLFLNGTFGESPYIPAAYFVMRRCPNSLSQPATVNINGDANAAHVIYEILTNYKWGLGKGAGEMDLVSFQTAATTLHAEGLGVSGKIEGAQSGEQIIGELLRHVDGVIFTHPTTGKITMKLARADYVVGTLPVFDTSNSVKESYGRSSWADTYNEVKVSYVARGAAIPYAFKEDVQQAQNLASVQAMGRVTSMPVDYPWVSNGDTALKQAFRELRIGSVPLAKAHIRVNRNAFNLLIGGVFVWNWAPLGISGLVLRITAIDYGNLDEGEMSLDCIEDVFAAGTAAFTAPPNTDWVPPSIIPVTPLHGYAMFAPYWFTTPDLVSAIQVMFGRLSKATYGIDIYTSVVLGGQQTLYKEDQPFCPVGALVSDTRADTPYVTSLVVQNLFDLETLAGTDAAGVARGDLLAVIDGSFGDEIISWETIVDNGDGTFTLGNVRRGVLDTVPKHYLAGNKIYFFEPGGFAVAGDEFAASDVPYPGGPIVFEPRAKALGGMSAIGVAAGGDTGSIYLDPTRPDRSYAPGDPKVAGVAANNVASPYSVHGDLVVSWGYRDRLVQTDVDREIRTFDDPDLAVEPGVTHTVEVWAQNPAVLAAPAPEGFYGAGVLLRTVTGIAGNSYTYTDAFHAADLLAVLGAPGVDAGYGRPLLFLVRSVRGGIDSIQKLGIPGVTGVASSTFGNEGVSKNNGWGNGWSTNWGGGV